MVDPEPEEGHVRIRVESATELPDAELANRSITVRRLQRPADLRPLEKRALDAAADGRLVPVVGRRFPSRDAAEAHRAIEARATVGKTVLRPGSLT